MAIIRQNRLWNGIQTRQEINNETGAIEVFAVGVGLFGVDALVVSSEGKGSDWKIDNPQTFTNIFNKKNGTKSSVKEVERAFFLEGYKVFNNDRANVLNAPSSYDDDREGLIARQRFFNQGTPRIVDPSTSVSNNSEGDKTTEQVSPKETVDADTGTAKGPGETNVGADTTTVENKEEADGSKDNTKSVPKSAKRQSDASILRYPSTDLSFATPFGFSYDYIKIGIVGYVPSIGKKPLKDGKADFGLPGTGNDAVTRYKKSSLQTIMLPMIAGLSSQNGISWGSDSMNVIQQALGQSIASALQGVGEEGFSFELLTEKLKALGTSAQGLAQNAAQNKDIVAGLLAGYVTGNSSIAARSTGAVINPNLELLFSGPQLRTFQFNFNFAPRFGAEAKVVAQIIKTLKKHSAPKIDKGGSIFLKTPDIFKLQYIYNGDGSESSGGDHPYLNKIKPCALTSIGVNYTPGGTYMTYQGDGEGAGSMTQTMLSLTFTELEPIYDIDYEDNHLTGY